MRSANERDTDDKINAHPEDLSFEDVAKELSGPLGRYLQRVVADRSIAEDLLQETLIRIARGLPDFEGLSSVKTWAYTIATRIAMDHFRKRGASPLAVDESEASGLPDDAPTPEQRLALDQMNACVREVVAALPEEFRIAIMLHDFGGLSARETATACGCSEANAKIRIHRARAKLKTVLQKECNLYREEDNVLRCHRRD
ncbi:MAG TPA: RNA polymerase sigma factor [Gallionellaceae bacterium]|nr:RNA polymerase sigma factor [Gallionellaceae bacterium]